MFVPIRCGLSVLIFLGLSITFADVLMPCDTITNVLFIVYSVILEYLLVKAFSLRPELPDLQKTQ